MPQCGRKSFERIKFSNLRGEDMSSSDSKTGTAQIGVTGLAVMGSNLARNFAHHGYTVALHNRSDRQDRRAAQRAR